MKGLFDCKNMDYKIGLTKNEIKALNRGEEVSGSIQYWEDGKSVLHTMTIVFKPKREIIGMKSGLRSSRAHFMEGPHVMVTRQDVDHFAYYIVEEVPDIEKFLLSDNPTAQFENRYDSQFMNKIFLYHEE